MSAEPQGARVNFSCEGRSYTLLMTQAGAIGCIENLWEGNVEVGWLLCDFTALPLHSDHRAALIDAANRELAHLSRSTEARP